ncbi:MAG: hypothetical protein R2827_12290 [Bdellovibrionales bacterium]
MAKVSTGGHFFEFLSRRYGVDQINQFYLNNGSRWINPFLLNKSFEETFGSTFDDLFIEFQKSFSAEAQRQILLQDGEEIAFSRSYAGMSAQKDSIQLITTDLINERELHLISKQTGEVLSTARDWLFGTPFIYKGAIHTLGSHMVDTPQGLATVTGLYKKGYEVDPDTMGKIIQDIQDDQVLYFDVNNGFLSENILYENGQPIGVAHSRAIYSPDGTPYFFRQVGKERHLIRRDEAVFSFTGQFAKVTDFIGNDPIIVGNTPGGSGLFLIRNGRSYRMHPADNIIEAKVLSYSDFAATLLVNAVTSEGYQYKKLALSLEELPEQLPHQVIYRFRDIDSPQNLDEILARTPPVDPASLKVKEYSPLSQLRYSQTLPYFVISVEDEPDGSGGTEEKTYFTGGFSTTWNDPLLQNTLA